MKLIAEKVRSPVLMFPHPGTSFINRTLIQLSIDKEALFETLKRFTEAIVNDHPFTLIPDQRYLPEHL